MSTGKLGINEEETVSCIHAGREYTLDDLLSNLLRKPKSQCKTEKEYVKCEERKILEECYGLLPLGNAMSRTYFGDNIIEAKINRARNNRIESSHNHVPNMKAPSTIEKEKQKAKERAGKKAKGNASVDPAEGDGGPEEGEG